MSNPDQFLKILAKRRNITKLESYLVNKEFQYIPDAINDALSFDIFNLEPIRNNFFPFENGKNDLDIYSRNYLSFLNLYPLVQIKSIKFLHSRSLKMPYKIRDYFINKFNLVKKIKPLLQIIQTYFYNLKQVKDKSNSNRKIFKSIEEAYSNKINLFLNNSYLTYLFASFALKQLVIYKISSAYRRLGDFKNLLNFKRILITNSGDSLQC